MNNQNSGSQTNVAADYQLIFTFSSKTQYDKSFDYLYKDYPQAKRGVSGPIFAIVTACEYLKSAGLPVCLTQEKEKHETNINRSVTLSSILSISANTGLDMILKDTDIKQIINHTSVEYINRNNT